MLGLRPGAGRLEVDEAYRRLIKLHHPDRLGGDGSRAAEINRAYTQLRRQMPAPAEQRRSFMVPLPPERRRRRLRLSWPAAASLLAAGGIFAAIQAPQAVDVGPLPLPWVDRESNIGTRGPAATDFEEPLHASLIDRSIADAVQFYATGDSAATLEFSRSCHNSLRDQPSLARFDSCAAFDEATAVLNSDNALAEGGPFSATAVVARHIAGARLLSADMLVADSRLDQIRSRVELNLLPRMDDAAVAAMGSEP